MNTRRHFLHLATFPAFPTIAGLTTLGAAAQSLRPEPDISPLIEKLTGGKTVTEGRVQITLPMFAENGQSVPLTIAAAPGESPVKSLHVFAPRNPRPNIANFFFGPRAGKPVVNTRIRLAGSQTVRVIAVFADGGFGSGSAAVEVTASACLDQSGT